MPVVSRNFKVMTSKDLQWRIKIPGYQNIIIQRPIKNVPFLVLVLKDPCLYLQIPVHTVLQIFETYKSERYTYILYFFYIHIRICKYLNAIDDVKCRNDVIVGISARRCVGVNSLRLGNIAAIFLGSSDLGCVQQWTTSRICIIRRL